MSLKQHHLDLLHFMKQEFEAILSTGDNSPSNDHIRRFSNIVDIIAAIAGEIINQKQSNVQTFVGAIERAGAASSNNQPPESNIFSETVRRNDDTTATTVAVENHEPLQLHN